MKKLLLIIFVSSIVSSIMMISCKDKDETINSFILKSDIKDGEKVTMGQSISLYAEYNKQDITTEKDVKYIVNGKEIENNQYLTSEAGTIKIMAVYKGNNSNVITIEVEQGEISELIISHDKQSEQLTIGEKINFKVLLKVGEKTEDVTSDSNIYIDGKPLGGSIFVVSEFYKGKTLSVMAEYQKKETRQLQFIVESEKDKEEGKGDTEIGLTVIRKYSSDRMTLSTEFSSIRIDVLGHRGNGSDEPKQIKVGKYNIEGREIECTRWNIEFVSKNPGHQATITLLVPVNGDKIMNPMQSGKPYVYSLNVNLPGEKNEQESLTLSLMNKDDAKQLSNMHFSFKKFAFTQEISPYLAEVSINFESTLQTRIRDNYNQVDHNVNINFICNEVEAKNYKFGIDEDHFNDGRFITINNFSDLF